MRHDEERPRSNGFLSNGTVPGHWTQVIAGMRADPFTRLSLDDVFAEAAHLLILAPSLDVAWACFGELLGEVGPPSNVGRVAPPTDTVPAEPSPPHDSRITITAPDDLVASAIPAGTWIFLPHRQDGWTELESTSARVRADLVKENSARAEADRLVLIEYGINLWTWAEPPSCGGDPVCHAGELISWETAWTMSSSTGLGSTHSSCAIESAAPRPPIYFGLPPILRKRRREV